ncbi:GGDEF domain-containing protein [Novosphingobium beihaiensis]|uniref:diguanylate cyclase n=1 Tax=Novosphingobium beihaiensis TaxID=2930389 RepID=A0ABT0BW08_9SPHN|nr:diguanylate cyclase [Novosphingobium beihaiensis]MCJ2189238.1 diguanylate cyclase [Novosphingobium beihaiensis]
MRRWLGFGGGKPDALDGGTPPLAPQSEEPVAGRPGGHGAQQLEVLADISEFLMVHELPVNPFTLEAAYDIVTGSKPRLAAIATARLTEGLPLTLDWLEEIMREEATDGGTAQLHALIVRLEKTIDEFANTASVARTATTDYNSALEAHVGDLDTIDTSENVIEQITNLAHHMLERTREVARELTRSERETRTLQKQLADARAEAEIDHLTGLPNRRAFEARYNQVYSDTRKSGEPLCVAFCDIDEFKRVNDKHGHEAGDRVLRTVAQSLATMADDQCHVARHGGEEFVVLMRNKMIEDACTLIDEARQAIAARRLINRTTDVPFGQITLSAGVADVHAFGDAREALRAADNALLQAKDAGRNVVLKASKPD